MRMNWKRLLAFLLCLLMLGTAFPAFTAAAEDLELIPIIDETDEFDPDDEIAVIDEDLLTPPRSPGIEADDHDAALERDQKRG